MKKLIVVLLLLFTNTVFAQTVPVVQIHKDGFNNIKWGTDINKLKDMELIYFNDNLTLYEKESNLIFENIRFRTISYWFENNKFIAVKMEFDNSYRPYLVSRLTEKHGEPFVSKVSSIWESSNTALILENNELWVMDASIVESRK